MTHPPLNWIPVNYGKPEIGKVVIGLNPVNYGTRSEYWEATLMKRIDKELAQTIYRSTDPNDFEVDEWYSPIYDIEDECGRPWVWAYVSLPSRLPSDYFPDGAPAENTGPLQG